MASTVQSLTPSADQGSARERREPLPGSTAAALVWLPASLASAAECAPEKMVRIVTRDATPGIDPQSFPALPKTLYRLGNGRGRVEEMPDPARSVHGLIVVNEPDGWIVNLHDKTGRHLVDPGSSLIFRAPILD